MAPSTSHSQSLLPNPGILILDQIDRDADRFRLRVHVEQDPACPLCGEVSQSRHSCYCRCLQDFPWQGVSVQLWATVGRFRCRNSSCPRRIFCERLPQIARVYGRQTERASEIVRLIGYVAGGLPGQRLLARLSIANLSFAVGGVGGTQVVLNQWRGIKGLHHKWWVSGEGLSGGNQAAWSLAIRS